MESSKYKPSRMLIVFAAMAVLLPLLAALQYYWLGQVSEAATERLQMNLQANAKGFRQDFNREFIRAFLNFQIDSSAPPTDIELYHLERFEHWNKTAPYPRQISAVFLVSYDEQDQPRLSRLNPEAKRFEVTEWPVEFLSLRDRLGRNDEGANKSAHTSLESVAEEIPALIIPFPFSDTENLPIGKAPPPPPGFTIVKLDLDYLQREFIPSLIQRHLFDASHSDYNVAIVSLEDPRRVIYSSRIPMVDFESPDVSIRVLGLDDDELRAFVSSQGTASAGATQAPIRPIRLRLLKRSALGPSSGEENGRWQLLIKHQAGSLAAAVSSARRRNLAISFGILLLLGTGVFMTAISTRRAQRLARQQIDFVAGVSHELRTPLAVICSAGENLADGIVDTPQKAAQYGKVIYREGRRLTDMVEQVLEFAGAESGRQRYVFRPTSVADFIAGAITACQTQIKERHFNIETFIEPNLPLVQGDAAALRRTMQNLISNAIKYDGKNRWARISAQAWSGARGSEVRITINDRGLGIPPADIPHIFKPFYRGREAISARIEGSGIGLSLVNQIIETHGGRIEVKSTPGTGSTFSLYLPVAGELREPTAEESEDDRV